MSSLRISEIFYSLQGEAKTVGLPTVFIRLTGCPLRCEYCDTSYAFSGGEIMALDAIMDKVKHFSPRYITVTGGEPLAQPNSLELMRMLCDQGYLVSIETSGALDVSSIDERVSVVMDLKTPASKEVQKNRYENLPFLKQKDQLKFVICDRQDYDWAKFKLDEHNVYGQVGEILFSASHGALAPELLADWIIEDNLQVRLQVQLHKYLWGDKPGV